MPRSSAPPPLAPAEIIVGSLAWITVALTAWGFAGRASWAPPTFTSLAAVTALAALLLARREGRPVQLLAFLPFLLFSLYLSISLLNPSHTPVPGFPGRWLPREGWITWLPTTLDRATTLAKMLPWLAALLLGAALRQTQFSRRGVRLLWGLLLAHGLLLTLVGLYFHVTDPHQILGLVRDRHGYHFSSFVYRNHWAAYLLLLVPLALGFAFSALHRWAAERGRLDAVVVGLGAALILAVTAPIPGSRSGTVLMALLLLLACGQLLRVVHRARRHHADAKNTRWRLATLIAFIAVVLGAGTVLTRHQLEKHWQRTQMQVRGLASGQGDLRLQLSRDTFRMASDRPLWGWGVGSYGQVFHLYQGNYLRDSDGRINTRVMHAHNDWAHLAAELGLFGFPLLLLPVVWRLRTLFLTPGSLAAWSRGGLLLLLGYAWVEFPFHNPAVLLLFTAILCAPHTKQPTSPSSPRLP